ncbi:MAG: hypothetical protein PVI30_13320 [Myxococcales bacterium]|jgi:hypothetical protein
MDCPQVRMAFADAAALARELDQNLRHGRAFVKDAEGVAVLSDCELVLVHPDSGQELALPAQAVMVADAGPMCGVGVELRPFDNQVLMEMQHFVNTGEAVQREPEPPPRSAPPIAAPEPMAIAGSESESESEPETGSESETGTETGAETESETETETETESASDTGITSPPSIGPDRQAGPSRHERLRKLSVTDQQKIARKGELNDRILLERLYGRNVWEGLLRNPKLTIPEVARIARKGTVPRPLLDIILDNNAWIQAATVRRALLNNPRIMGEAVMKLLRITPKHELKAITKSTAYPSQVREAAKKLLKL